MVSLFLSSGTNGSNSNFWNQPGVFYGGVSAPCVLGLVLANIISRTVQLPKPECVTIAIESCYQNVGIATSVAVSMFTNKNERSQAVSVPLVYGAVEAVVIGIYCLWAWKVGWTKAPPGTNLWVVMTKTYEVTSEDRTEEQGHEPEQDNSQDTNTLERSECTNTDSVVGLDETSENRTEEKGHDLEQNNSQDTNVRERSESTNTDSVIGLDDQRGAGREEGS